MPVRCRAPRSNTDRVPAAPAPAPLSREALRTLAHFGLTLADLPADDSRSLSLRRRRIASLAQRVHTLLTPGRVVLVIGPSGSGKSALLSALADLARADGRKVVEVGANSPRPHSARIIDAVHRRLARRERARGQAPAHTRHLGAMAALAAAGLADARLALTRCDHLSEGERARLALALALAEAQTTPRSLLIADELGASLDGPTAASVAAALARSIRRGRRFCAVVATHRPEVVRALSAEVVVRIPASWLLTRCP